MWRSRQRVTGVVMVLAVVVGADGMNGTPSADAATTDAPGIVDASGAVESGGSEGYATSGEVAGTTESVGAAGSCSWGVVLDAGTKNWLWPDSAAVYWTTPFTLSPGAELVIGSEYADARYFSFQTYELGTLTDAVTDFEIVPDPGYANPFADANADSSDPNRYTVRVRPGISIDDPEPNTLAAFPGGARSGQGFLTYRVYVPTDPNSPPGGPLPQLSLSLNDGAVRIPIPPCPSSEVPPFSGEYPLPPGEPQPLPGNPAGTAPPATFGLVSAANLFENEDNAYLAAVTPYEAGQIVVVRGRAPDFPDNRNGERVTDPYDVRYWGLCSNELTLPLPTAGCAADHGTALSYPNGPDGGGWFTFVVSTFDDQPANLDAEEATWINWGRPGTDNLLQFRTILPGPDFAHAVQAVPELGQEREAMGEYYPEATICATATFEQGGVAACFS